jgi:putative ABC transport system permease protein
MNTFSQIAAVTAMNLRSLPQRVGTSLVIVIGIAGVVGVLISVLAMSTGMLKTLTSAGRDDRAIVLRNGSAAEAASTLTLDAVRTIGDAAGVRRTADGKPIMSAEAFRVLTVYKREDGSEANIAVRGVGPQVTTLRPELKIVEGRMFEPALTEVIVGQSAHRQFRGLDVGDTIRTRGANWKVVGIYSTGDAHDSELMADIEALVSAENRGARYQSVTVKLESPRAFSAFKDSLTSNPALSVDVWRESEYYAQQSKAIGQIISTVAYVVGGIMAIGAVFSALNTMYSAVSARVREIATLRALGFGAAAMVISVLVEALLLAAIGGGIGALAAWLFFHGRTASTSASVFGHLIFELTVNAELVIIGIVVACAIGLIGGLFPAIRAARLPVVDALRAV